MNRTVERSPQLQSIGRLIAILSLAAIGFATLRPESGYPVSGITCIICGSRGGVDAILNVLLFLPLGVGLALAGMRARHAALAVVSLSALIEIAQYLGIAGRAASVGDVLTNSIGGAIGFSIARFASSWLRPSPRIAVRLVVGWGFAWLVVQTVSAFSLASSFPNSRYYGQLGRSFSDLATFRGRILRAAIDSMTVPDFVIANTVGMRTLLQRGATVEALVVPAEPTTRIAPILRIADREREQIVLLAQRGTDLVFGVRTGADILRLRGPLFAMAGVFPRSSAALDSVATQSMLVSGHFGPDVVGMRVQWKSSASERRLPLTSSLGWTLTLPFQWYRQGSWAEHVLSWMWIFFLALPATYWATWTYRSSPDERGSRLRLTPAIGIVAILVTGLGFVPRIFGLAATPLVDWIAALLGLVAGSALAVLIHGKRHVTLSGP